MVVETLSDLYSIITILVMSIGVFCYIYGKRGLEYRNLLFIGFALRMFLLFADYYHWFPILNSGADSEIFHRVAVNNATSMLKLSKGGYADFLTVVYRLTSCSRLIAQFINVLFGMGIILVIQQTVKMLSVDRRNELIVICVLIFLPNLNIFSAILLREAWVEYFVALSVLFFVRWFINGGALNIVLAIGAVLTACYMHAGVIGLLMGYIVAFITYNPASKQITFSKSTIVSLIFLVGLSVGLSGYMGFFTAKFAAYDSIEDIVAVTNKVGGGGADYLTWINSNSVAQSFMFAPLKMFYFLFSPLPTEWRGLTDIIGFLIDGLIYMVLCYGIVKYRADTLLNKQLKKYLIISLLVVVFIFAFGTKNAGTAFRHRAKIIPIIAVVFAISTIKTKEYE